MTNQKGGTNTTKDVIYIDVDDEITGVIDKLQGSDKKIVALVLPKRATVLQSIVNMKLLKRAATESKKNLVLITSEAGLMPLAGNVGIHVAKSLNTKPEIPDGPALAGAKADTIEEVEDDGPVDASKSVGELSGDAPSDDAEDHIELDDEEEGEPEPALEGGKKAKKHKKFKIPNFNKFRVMLALAGVAIILLGILGYAAAAIWPAAKITIKTDSSAVSSSVILTLKTEPDTKLDAAQGIVPATLQDVKKTISQDAPATGQKNNGQKATGSVNMSAKNCSTTATPASVPTGTGVSAGGKTYITQEKANFAFDSFVGGCIYFKANNISISAQSAGAAYNVTGATFTVGGRSDVSASGSADGGTDEIVKIVTQADVDGASAKIVGQDNKPVQQELKSALIGRGLLPLEATFNTATPETKLSAEVGTVADTVTVTQTVDYSMLGAKQDDLEKVIENDVSKKIDTKKQTILSHGIDSAFFGLQAVNPDGASLSMQTTVVAGAEIKPDVIKQQVAGKKSGDAKELILANPGVTDVTVDLSPFWVSSIPKKAAKITVVIQEPKVSGRDAGSP